jgi:ABC-type amino acid transport system permease subunit
MIPGDPIDAMLGQYAERSAREALRHELGLDQPLWRQYISWIGRVAHCDLGRSIRAQQPVRDLIVEKLPATLLITTSAAVIALLIAFPAGVVTAVKRNTFVDLVAMVGALLGVSIPSFSSGIMLIMIFALTLGWLPAIGYARITTDPVGALCYLILSALTLGSVMAGSVTRRVRAQLPQELGRDYVRTARSKGLREAGVIVRHALRNSLQRPARRRRCAGRHHGPGRCGGRLADAGEGLRAAHHRSAGVSGWRAAERLARSVRRARYGSRSSTRMSVFGAASGATAPSTSSVRMLPYRQPKIAASSGTGPR